MSDSGVVNTLYHADLISFLETKIPGSLSESWDNCGLQAGSRQNILKGVVCCLDISEAVVDEAVACGANFIISHHPLLFKPLSNLDWDVFPGSLLRRALDAEITLYSAHTNLDNVAGGVNDRLADLLGIGGYNPLQVYSGSCFKLVTFVPEVAVETVAEALFAAGAGHVGGGDYSECSFRSFGTGTFRPGVRATPQVGEIGRRNYVKEIRFETVVPETLISPVISVLFQVHPYEVPAYDLYPINFRDQSCGAGRVGMLKREIEIGAFAAFVKKRLRAGSVRLIGGHLKPEVKRIALCGGSGFSLYNAAQAAGADLFITGDMKYHDARSVLEQGKIPVLDAGHFATERPVVEVCADWCREFVESKKVALEVIVAKSEREPWTVK